MKTISIIIPTLNEAKVLPFMLESLQAIRKHNVELIIVDGGSDDDTLAIAGQFADIVISSKAGRARQLNKGAKAARGDLLLFLHADTQLPNKALELLNDSLKRFNKWGRFNVKLDDPRLTFRLIEKMMNWRSCLTGIVTGDQAMFVSKVLFEKVGGYPEIELMEDIAISKVLKKTCNAYLPKPSRCYLSSPLARSRCADNGTVDVAVKVGIFFQKISASTREEISANAA